MKSNLSNARFFLLLAGDGKGYTLPISVRRQKGVIGFDLKVRLNPQLPAESDLMISAQAGASQAYQLLWSEGLERSARRLVFQLVSDPSETRVKNIEGRSSDLLFALSLLGSSLGKESFPVLAATGRLGEKGEVLPVTSIPEKLQAALGVLPSGGHVLIPEGNKQDVPNDLFISAADKGIQISFVSRLDEAAAILGMEITTRYLESPFRGLEAFDLSHSSLYFGRDKHVTELTSLLKAQQRALVFGPSGSGKSSLIQAGVLAELSKRSAERYRIDYKWGVFRPRDIQAYDGLKTALLSAWTNSCFPTATLVSAEPQVLMQTAESIAVLPDQQLLFIVDQLEELFSVGITEQELQEFCDYLNELQAHGCWVIATMRNDFYPSYQASALSELFPLNSVFNLGFPDQYELQQMIELPAKIAGLVFEERDNVSLAAYIREEAAKAPSVLPLLEFTLSELYSARDKEQNMLTFDAYQKLGGIKGSISRAAESVFYSLDTPLQEVFPDLILKLTHWHLESERFVAASYVVERDCDEKIRQIITRFSAPDVRLLVLDKQGDKTIVRITHEALISEWELAISWLEENKTFMRWLSDIERAATHWQEQGRSSDFIKLKGKPLNDALSYLAEKKASLSGLIIDYIQTAKRLRNRTVTFGAIFLSSVFIALTLLSLSLFEKSQVAIEEAKKANQQLDQTKIAQSRYLLTRAHNAFYSGDYHQAMLMALNALPGAYGGNRPEGDYIKPGLKILNEASMLNRQVAVLPRSPNSVFNYVSISPDGQLVASRGDDGSVSVSETEHYETLLSFKTDKQLMSVEFVQGKDQLLVLLNPAQSDDQNNLEDDLVVTGPGEYQLWSIQEKRLISEHKLDGAFQFFSHAVPTADPELFIFSLEDGRTLFWDIEKGRLRKALPPSYRINPVVSSDGNYVAFEEENHVSVYEVNSAQKTPFFRTPFLGTGVLLNYAFSNFEGENNLLLIYQSENETDSRVHKWNIYTGEEEWRRLDLNYGIQATDIHEDRSTFYFVSDSKLYSVHQSDSGMSRPYVKENSHFSEVGDIKFSEDKKYLLARTINKIVLFTQEDDGDQYVLDEFRVEGAISEAGFVPLKEQIYVVTADRTVIWDFSSHFRSAFEITSGVVDFRISKGKNKLVVLLKSGVSIYDLATMALEQEFKLSHGKGLRILDLKQDSVLLSVQGQGVITIDLADGKSQVIHPRVSGRASMSDDGSGYIVLDDDAWLAYIAQRDELVRINMSDQIAEAFFLPQSNDLIVRRFDGHIHQLNYESGTWKSVNVFEHEDSSDAMALSPEGDWLASLDFETIKVWSLSGDATKSTPNFQYPYYGAISHIEFSPNAEHLLISDLEGGVNLLNLGTGSAELIAPYDDMDPFDKVGYSTSGNALYVTSKAGSVQLIDADQNEPLLDYLVEDSRYSSFIFGLGVSDEQHLFIVGENDTLRVHPLLQSPITAAKHLLLAKNGRCIKQHQRPMYFLESLTPEEATRRGCQSVDEK